MNCEINSYYYNSGAVGEPVDFDGKDWTVG